VDRAEALAIVTPVLEQLFQDNTLEQTLLLWSHVAEQFPERIGPILTALEVLASDTSLELRPILVRHGWINLFHTVDGVPVIYTADEHREWLKQLIPLLRQAAGA
jgi:hypothetical protein